MNYVRNAWYVACWAEDLPEAKPLAMTILGEPIAIFRSEAQIAALEDRCVHRLAPLSLGRCEGHQLRCMYHGILYRPDGTVSEVPGQDIVPPQAKVRSYPAIERHSWIWIWMGEDYKADASLIPPAVGLESSDYILGHGQLDYDAEARLINDNLLDFSHLTYVHADSFGSDADFASFLPTITPLPRGIRYQRWIENTFGSASRRTSEPMDNFMTYDFLLPGILLMQSGVFPPGSAKATGFERPDPRRAVSGLSFTSQAVTPLTAKTSRYFFSWGPHRDHGDESTRDRLMELASQAFSEDRKMIEAQQRIVDASPEQSVMPTAHDRGITLFNRLVARMVRDEQALGDAAR